MNETIPELINKLITKEKESNKLDNEIKQLKKRKQDFKKKELEKDKIDDEIKKLWELILNRIPSFIKGNNQKEMIESSKIFGERFYKGGLSTSQIRNVFGEVKKNQMKTSMNQENFDFLQLRMLLPKLAYSAARAKKKGTDELRDVLSKGIETVLEKDIEKKIVFSRFENFANFFEAILAYHKAAGGN